jgi:hypothetical protein
MVVVYGEKTVQQYVSVIIDAVVAAFGHRVEFSAELMFPRRSYISDRAGRAQII